MDLIYKGIPLEELRIESVEWTEDRAEHIRSRSIRKGTAELDVEPEWATEAALDPGRIVGLTTSESIKVIGYSGAIDRILKIWLFPKDLEAGDWWGASACEANGTDRRNYKEADE